MKKIDFEEFDSKDISDGYDTEYLETYKIKSKTVSKKAKFSYKANICNPEEKNFFFSN